MNVLPALVVILCGCGSDKGAGPAPDHDSAADTSGSSLALASTVGAVSLLADGQLNHLLPVRVAVDSAHRRAWSVGNGLQTLAEVDLDSEGLVGVYALGEVETSNLLVYADGEGVVWLVQAEGDPVLRFDPLTHAVTTPPLGGLAVYAAAPLPTGGLVLASSDEATESGTLTWLDANGALGLELAVDGVINGLAQADAGELGVVISRDHVTTLLRVDTDSAELIGSCVDPAGIAGVGGLVEMTSIGHGYYATTEDHTIMVLGCEGEVWSQVRQGQENRSPIWTGDSLVVLDRVGVSSLQNANYGVARRFDAALNTLGRPFEIGKHGGYGGYDPDTARIWVNSEGTGELWSLDPELGMLEARVRLGAHVETVAANPADPDVVWFTGRLCSTVGRVDLETGEVSTADEPWVWPVSPVYATGRLWFFDHVLNAIYGLNPDTLAVEVSATFDLTDNTALTFDDLAYDGSRGTLFASISSDNLLLEISAETGEELGRWALAGDPLADPDLPGRLEVLPAGSEILVVRDNDGVVSAVDPSTGEVRAGQLDADTVSALQRSLRLDRVTLSPDGSWFWAGADAYALADLARLPEHDLGASYAMGPFGDGMLAFDDTLGAVVALNTEGEIVASATLAPDDRGEVAFELLESADGPRLSFSRFSSAEVVGWSLNEALAP